MFIPHHQAPPDACNTSYAKLTVLFHAPPPPLAAALLVWFLGVAFPFYSSINAFMGAISAPVTAFALPALAFNVIYKRAEARDKSVQPPPKAFQVGLKAINQSICNWE